MDKVKGIIAVFLGACSYGVLSTIVRGAYEKGYLLGDVTGIQVIFGASILWILYILMYIVNNKRFETFPRKTKFWKIMISGLSSGAVSLLYYKAVQLIPASLCVVLLVQYIWISLILEFIIFRTKPSRRQLISIFIVLIATVFATGFFEKEWSNISLVGIGFALLASTAYSILLIVNARVGNDHPPIAKSAMMVSGACVLICTLYPPINVITGNLPDFWFFGLTLSLFGTVIPPLLYAYGIPKVGVPIGSILVTSELPVAVTMSYVVLHEAVSPIQWIGVVAILGTVVWLNLGNISKKNLS